MQLIDRIRESCTRRDFQERMAELLFGLCALDTSPAQELASLRENEDRAFRLIERQLRGLSFRPAEVLRRPVDPTIFAHPAFSRPYYARGSVEEVYRRRCNLVYRIEPAASERAAAGQGVAFNAHIDTVAPYLPPAREDGYLTGRGSADDKGNAAVLVGAMIVLDELARQGAAALKNSLTAMFVIDEETGGNGSLSLAVDRRLRERYGSIVVLECTDKVLHPANRGAVFIRCECSRSGAAPEGLSLAEACACGVLELLREGERIKGESVHPLFPHRPVQTCTGILGPFGAHPSAICGELSFLLRSMDPALGERELSGVLEKGLAEYVALFGDKVREGRIGKHFTIQGEGDAFRITVHGASGHMGSLPQNDAAIAKWAYLVGELVLARRAAGLRFSLTLTPEEETLIFEGAQGFLPTHSMEEVMARSRRAFLQGIQRYLEILEAPPGSLLCEVSFEKLHNDAFAGDPDSPSLRRAVRAATELGLMSPGATLRGWDVSCDARLFAKEYPGLPVITFGAGRLVDAHSERERIRLQDLFDCIPFVVLFSLYETGSMNPEKNS